MTTVETRVVDPVPSHGSVDVSQSDLVDEVLARDEEDKMLEDEEIESCEGEDLEEHMLKVALLNSVVESGTHSIKSDGSPQSPRYGLRKRPRPTESSENGVTEVSNLKTEPSVVPKATIRNGRLSLVMHSTGEQSVVSQGINAATPPLQSESSPGNGLQIPPNPLSMGETKIGEGVHKPPLAPNISSHCAPANSSSIKTKKATSPRQTNGRHTSRTKAISTIFQIAPMNDLVPTSGAVPNPLAQSTPPPLERPVTMKVDEVTSSSVPCPISQTVPCPLESQTQDEQIERRVTIVEPAISMTRNRIFSVDLDPSTFDFPDMSGDHNDMEKADDDIGDITGDVPPPDDLAIFKRDRAFSFEFFTFAGDDLLPAPPCVSAPESSLPETSETEDYVTSRPRGDSIIFDPVSFQDGGIHEKNAIIKVNAAKEIDATPPTLFADSRLAAPSVPVKAPTPRPIAVLSHPGAPAALQQAGLPLPPSVDNGQLVTLPSALSVPDANGNTTGTFQMELLNKDGRIGIYLPEARRARIARFHAKRKMRIWRKRIKYDCRKKLADSRPRIKGRFVKRSDMDE